MSEYDDNDQGEESNPVRELREHAKTLEVNLRDAEKQVQVYKTFGPALSDKQMKALIVSHEGEFTPDALQATAAELGFVPKETPDPTPTPETPTAVSDAEMQAHQRIAEATAQGTPPAPTTPDQRIKDIRDRVARISNPDAIPGLREELLAAIAEHPNLEFGEVDISATDRASFDVAQTSPLR